MKELIFTLMARSTPPGEPRTRPRVTADAGTRDATTATATARPLDARASTPSPRDAGRHGKPDAKLWNIICE